ncbi:MAG: CapA family protein [Ilumatobacteraceae bacterium]
MRRVSMAFSGDTLPHSPLWRQAERNAAASGIAGYDFDPMMADLVPLLDEVDVAVCHLETPIAPDGEELSTMPRYGVPPEVVGMLGAAGWDRCSTASNHTIDRGFEGIVRTVDTFDAYGLGQVGMARTPDEIEPRVFESNGVAITHLSYTWSYNGLVLPAGDEWQSALIDPDRILADALIARSLGAEIVVVSLHWGAEGVHEPTTYQRRVAERLTEPGIIDLIVGHHAHVVQPIELVNDTWVLFGLGNILSNLPTSDRWPAASQDAAIVTVSFEVTSEGVTAGRPTVYPTWVDKDAGWIVRLVQDELTRDDIGSGQRGRLDASLARTAAVLGDFLAEP